MNSHHSKVGNTKSSSLVIKIFLLASYNKFLRLQTVLLSLLDEFFHGGGNSRQAFLVGGEDDGSDQAGASIDGD